MNAFQKVIQGEGLSTNSQGDAGWLYALMMLGSFDYEGADTFANPAYEVVRRLEAANIGGHTLNKVKPMLARLGDKFAG